MKEKIITKADIVLLILLVLIGVASPFFIVKNEIEEGLVLISKNGELYGSYILSEDQEIIIDANDELNIVVIKDKKVYVKEASCKGHDCIQMGEISKAGEIIACLPNRVLISIESKDIDVVLK